MQASKLNSKLPLPLYGLAQIMVRQREYTNAVSLLERALAEVPGWPDALNMLGSLYPQAERKGQAAFTLFQEAAEADSKSGAVWEILGELLASSDPPGEHTHTYISPALVYTKKPFLSSSRAYISSFID